MKYTELTFTELVNKIGNSRFFDLPKMLKEILSRLTPQAPKYKVYTALLTQSGTDAPVATVLENTLGGDIVWSREDVGKFNITSNGLFTENKTTIDFGILNLVDPVNMQIIISDEITPNENQFQIYTRDISFSNVDGLGNIKIEIRVYN